ncbi:unnamed protein product [Brassica oleracea var. botrytis]
MYPTLSRSAAVVVFEHVTLLPMLLSSHRSSAHHVPFRAGFHHAVAVSSTLPLVPVACVSSWC